MNFGKTIRKFRRNTKAISPVIATLLMIAIAVVASLVVYAWVMGYMNFTTAKTGNAIQIQSVSYSTTTTTFTIYVQNVGNAPVQFSTGNYVFINNAAATGTTITGTTGTTPTLATGGTATITGQLTSLTPGSGLQSVTIKVTTNDGTFSQITQQFTI